MKGRVGVPVLYPLVLPTGRPALRFDGDEAVRLFSRAHRAYRDQRFGAAGGTFLAVAGQLLDTPDAPALAGARTVCYFNAVLATVAANRPVEPVRQWVLDHDPACLDTVEAFVSAATTR